MASTTAATQSKSDSGDKITNLLQSALKEASPSAQNTADNIDKLFREQQAAGGDAEEFIWNLWTIYIEVAKKVPANDPRQAFLVDVLAKLKAKKGDPVEIWGQKANMWDDLALFGPCMREAWNLSVKHDGSEADKARVQEWISLNAFAARILGAKIQSWMNFAIWELRAGLEEPLTSASAKDLHLATASAWLTHAGKALHTEAALGVKPEGQEAKILQGGSLIKEVTGNTTERWQFWKKRLAELAPEASSADVKAEVQTATAAMAKHESE